LLRLLAFKPTTAVAGVAEKKSLKVLAADAASTPRVQKLPVVPMAGSNLVPSIVEEKVVQAQLNQGPETTKIDAIPVVTPPISPHDVAAPTNAPTLVSSADGDFWFATVQSLLDRGAVTAMARELALQSQLIGRDSDQWLLRIERESLNQGGSRDRLATALAGAGFNVALTVEVGRVTDSPARRMAAAQALAQQQAEQTVLQDPLVQTLMREFAAKIVPGSIKPL